MSQTSYDLYTKDGIPGLKKDSRFDLVNSRIAAETIPFGYATVLDSVQDNTGYQDSVIVGLPAAITDPVDGIALFTQAKEIGEYATGDSVSSLRRGACWMVVGASATAVAYDAPAYLAASPLGTVSDVDGGTATVVGTFKSAVVAYDGSTNIALVEVNYEG